MDELHNADESMGSSERHYVSLPSFPNYRVGGRGEGRSRSMTRMLHQCSQQQHRSCCWRCQCWDGRDPPLAYGPRGRRRWRSSGFSRVSHLFPRCAASLPAACHLAQELTEEDADKLAALLERRLGKKFEDIELEDMTPEVTQEVRTRARAHWPLWVPAVAAVQRVDVWGAVMTRAQAARACAATAVAPVPSSLQVWRSAGPGG